MTEKIPIVSANALMGFEFAPLLVIVDIVKNEKEAIISIKRYIDGLSGDTCAWIDPLKHSNVASGSVLTFETCFEMKDERYWPKTYEIQRVNPKKWTLENDHWVSKKSKLEVQTSSSNAEFNRIMLEHMSNPLLFRHLMERIESIPRFNVFLSDEERDLICTASSVLAIGRSGTGKTTCILLRLFIQEM